MLTFSEGDKIQYTGESIRDLTHGNVYQICSVNEYRRYYIVVDDKGESNYINIEDASLLEKMDTLKITVTVKGANLDLQSNLEFTDTANLHNCLSKIFS